MDIKNKVVLITGGSRGIGLAITRELLLNGAGHVAILDIIESEGKQTVAKLNSEFGKDRVKFIHVDVTNTQELEAAFKTTTDTFKGLDIVINNAGLLNENDWERMILINTNAVIHSTLIAQRYMRKDKGGKGGTVINISSIYGLSPTVIAPIYVASKFAVIGFDWSMGQPYLYKKTGIRIMTICPGITDTKMVSDVSTIVMDFIDGKFAVEEIKRYPFQSPDKVGQGVVHLLKNGENGSIWVSEGGEPTYEVKIPPYSTLKAHGED